jgi:TonB family protein
MPNHSPNHNSKVLALVFTALAFGLIGVPTESHARNRRSKDSLAVAADQSKATPEMTIGVRLLMPTEGVNLSDYIQRLVTRIRHNWDALIPVPAQKGEKGAVTLKLRIQRDGSTSVATPEIEKSSGIDVFDKAAVKAVRKTTPFEALPTEFHGSFIEFQLVFFYNVPQAEIFQ